MILETNTKGEGKMLTNDEVIDRNLEQHGRFMLYALEHPDILDHIPKEAELILLPQDDEELCEVNLKVGKVKERKGDLVVYVKVGLTPETRTVMVPTVELVGQAQQ